MSTSLDLHLDSAVPLIMGPEAYRSRLLGLQRWIPVLTLFAGFLFSAGQPAWTADTVKMQVARALQEKRVDDRLLRLAEIGAGLSSSDTAEALATVESLDELRERAVFRDAIVRRWCTLAPAEAFEYVAQLPESRSKLDLIRLAVTACAKQDLARTAAAAEQLAGGRSRIEAIAIVAEAWAKADLPAAAAWARSLPSGPTREAALYNIRFIWVHADPVTAADEIRELPAGDTKNALTMNIAGAWAGRDPERAIVWAHGLENPAERELAYWNIAESWADVDPRQAGAFALQLPLESRQRAAVAVVARWATQDPKAAATWAIDAHDEMIVSRGMSEVMNVWTTVDLDSARHWIEVLEPAPLRDGVVQAYLDAVVEWAPDAGVRMAMTTSEPAARWQQVERCLRAWWAVDAAEARQWLEHSDVPAVNKQQWGAQFETGDK